MPEKHCLQCGVSIGETKKRYCSECAKQRIKETRKKSEFKRRRKRGVKPKGIIPDCNPPYDCMNNCKYSDCVRNTHATKAETEFLKAAQLPTGRDGKNCKNKCFPIIDDLLHKRSGRIV